VKSGNRQDFGEEIRNGRLLDVRCHSKVAFGRDEAGQKQVMNCDEHQQ